MTQPEKTAPAQPQKPLQPGDPARSTHQVDDNQDDLGRDVNDTARPSTDQVKPRDLPKRSN